LNGPKRGILIALLILLAAGVYGALIMLLVQRSSDDGPSEASSGPFATALDGYPIAVEQAQNWRADAEPINVSASWRLPTKEMLRNGSPTWTYLFFSPSAGEAYRVEVNQEGTEGFPESSISSVSNTIDTDQWLIDSRDAILLFLSEGGEQYLREEPVTTVRMRLSPTLSPGSVTWMISALSSTEQTNRSFLIDAMTGEVTEAQPLPSRN